jgi:dsDNA-specific endonuclease/ATPase MutS2
MQKELVEFIIENKLSPYNRNKTPIKEESESIFKTRDAKSIHNKVINKIAENFFFSDTSCLLDAFKFTQSAGEIKMRQTFFSSIPKEIKNDFLAEIKIPESSWKPKYDIVAVTENEKTFIELKKLNVPVKYLTSEEDVMDLENCDIVQAVDCENFQPYLEQLNQIIFVNDVSDVYLERYVELLSGHKKNLEVLEKNEASEEVKRIIEELKPLLLLTSEAKTEKLSRDFVENALERINDNISERIKNVSVSGSALFEMLSKNSLSRELMDIIEEEIEASGIAEEIFNKSIPVTLDEQEFNKIVKEQDSNAFVNVSEKIKRNSTELKKVPEKLARLENLLLMIDFYAGITKFIKEDFSYPEFSEEMLILDSRNIFLESPQDISFLLDNQSRCSILTGANSGGKTTLLEHVIQIISLFQLGLPASGKIKMPVFTEVYYFAKNKGSMNKGAFETLLTQMSKIETGKQTLILADEIESVTEPGVAGKILCATSEFFIKKNCFLVIATHLGREIKEHLPNGARIDGIEAKGLDENYELIVNHNPVLGRLAHSTPELIIEKMANTPKTKSEYIDFIFKWVKK